MGILFRSRKFFFFRKIRSFLSAGTPPIFFSTWQGLRCFFIDAKNQQLGDKCAGALGNMGCTPAVGLRAFDRKEQQRAH